MSATARKILFSVTVLSLALAAGPALAKQGGNSGSKGSSSKSFHSSKSFCQPSFKCYDNCNYKYVNRCYNSYCWPTYGCYDYGCYSPCYTPVIDVPLVVQQPLLLQKVPVRIILHR